MGSFESHIALFFDQLQLDRRLHASHVALYMALLFTWRNAGFTTPFIITRAGLMQLSRIGSKVTYHKCIRELVEYGYIEYRPTNNSYVGTRVRLPLLKTG